MRRLCWVGVFPFLAAEGVLYAAFLWWDIKIGGSGSNSIKYAAILLCGLFALLWAAFGGGDRLVAAAMLLTGGADTFLLELNVHYEAGLLLFCGVQACYFLRLYRTCGRSLWGLRLLLLGLSLGALCIVDLWEPLNLLALLYFTGFVCNILLSRVCAGKEMKCFAVGLCLFLCCDLCVAAYQFPQMLPQAVFEFVRVGMWLFYLPGQVLIALSGLPKSKFWRDEYENQ